MPPPPFPHTPEAPPSTPTAEGRLTSCLPVATSPQARPRGQGARPETTQRGRWEEGPCQDCWAPDSDAPPAPGWAGSGGQAANLGGTGWEAASWALGRWRALTSRCKAPDALLVVGEGCWAHPARGGGQLFQEMSSFDQNPARVSSGPAGTQGSWVVGGGPRAARGLPGSGQPAYPPEPPPSPRALESPPPGPRLRVTHSWDSTPGSQKLNWSPRQPGPNPGKRT